MSRTIESGKDEVAQLIKHFRLNYDLYHADYYKEAQARQDLIDPFFMSLGWDVRYENKTIAPDRREVILEQSQEIEGANKQSDYAFRFGKETQFFVEAKKPRVKVGSDSEAAYQLRRYGWTAKLPLSILTNFETLSVYDCRYKPIHTDSPSYARIDLFSYEEYPDRWQELWDVFSREAVWGGGFDRFAQSSQKKHGTSAVDTEFLKTIEEWRIDLANSFAYHNSGLNVEALNDAVQRTIDRIVFLRMAEDRGLERYETLMNLAEKPPVPAKGYELRGRIYLGFMRLCNDANYKYDAGIFDLSKEGDRLTPNLSLPDDVLRPILRRLYYPECPYNFRQMPVEILGSVYERFLGKVIRLTPSGKQAKVEEKPEVKKAGGVYYTPSYIVDEIVENTVGEWIRQNVPDSAPTPLPDDFRILDCACGSGSFLLGAYQYLLDYHLNWYLAHNPEKWETQRTPAVYPIKMDLLPGPTWRLTNIEKKRILINHIFGVDIDGQAVEVTKLSLLLKHLEVDRGDIAQLPSGGHLLPNLDKNIQRGNSLIDTKMYLASKGPDGIADAEELKRVRPFDWEQRFPEAMQSGGFDVVIGNPPYIRIQTLQEWAPLEVDIYKKEYEVARSGNYDIYVVFVERALRLLKQGGRMGYILPHKFFNAKYGQALRKLIADGKHLSGVVHFGDQQVFEGASTYTCLLYLTKDNSSEFKFIKIDDLNAWRLKKEKISGYIPENSITDKVWNFSIGKGGDLLSKLCEMPTKLEDITSRIFQGIKTSADFIYIVEELERQSGKVKIYSKEKDAELWLETDLLHPLVKGGDSKRYQLSRTNRLILFPYKKNLDGIAELIQDNILKHEFPLTWADLTANKAYLENRENSKMKGPKWYGYGRIQALDVMPLPKIFTPDIALHSSFSFDDFGEVFFTGGVAGGYGILVFPEYNVQYVLGLLNSRLLEWYVHQTATSMRGGYYSYESRFIRSLPIYLPDLSDEADSSRSAKLISLVDNILILNQKLIIATTSVEREMYQGMIDSIDKQIDEQVYELYGLTEEEIKIVEGG